MLYTIKCPKCGAEQKNLDLDETEGSFICSECSEEVKVDLNAIKESASDEYGANNGTKNHI